MPPLEERLRLAERTMTALATPGASELPPKIAIHPRPADSFVHAMPAHLRGDAAGEDLVGMKWVAGYATNADLGLPSISAVVVLNDPETGVPVAMLDGGPITAERTAAVSRRGDSALRTTRRTPDARRRSRSSARASRPGRTCRCSARVLPGATLHVFDRPDERAEALADAARATTGIAEAEVHESARDGGRGGRRRSSPPRRSGPPGSASR